MLGWLKDFISLIYPHLCASCGKTLYRKENCICSFCKVSFPKTNFHNEKDNPISKIFWGRAKVHSAAAYCFFNKGDKIQHVMHELKYKGNVFWDYGHKRARNTRIGPGGGTRRLHQTPFI